MRYRLEFYYKRAGEILQRDFDEIGDAWSHAAILFRCNQRERVFKRVKIKTLQE